MSTTDRVKSQTKRASAALSALRKARTTGERLAAAQALESAACQLRRALKQEASNPSGSLFVVRARDGYYIKQGNADGFARIVSGPYRTKSQAAEAFKQEMGQ